MRHTPPARTGSAHPARLANRRRLPLLAVPALLAAGAIAVVDMPSDAAVPRPGTTITGRATFYGKGPNPGMNCSFPAGVPADDLYAAVGPDEWMASGGCGGVLDVTGPKGTARVMVTDQCPECEPGHLDLSQDAFAKLGDLSAGIIPISYEAVADPPLPGPLAIRVKEGSSIWWTAFLVINHGNPLASVELKRPDGSWLALERTPYNQWLKQDGAGEAPYSLRITDLQGHRVVVDGIALEPTVVQTSEVFMYGTTSTPTTSTTRPTTTLPTTSTTRSTTSRTTKVRTKSKTTKAKTTKAKTSRSKTKTTKTRTTTRGVSGNRER